MGEEDCVPILSLRLEQLNCIVLLGCAVRTVFIVSSVKGANLAAEHGAFKGATSLADLFHSQFPRDRGTILRLKRSRQLRVRQQHRFELWSGESWDILTFVSLIVVLVLEMA